MKIRFNAAGGSRKALVKAISEITGAASRYLGAPSFAYEVDYFIIDREGTLIFETHADTGEIESLLEGLAERGFIAEADTGEEIETKEQEVPPDIEAASPDIEAAASIMERTDTPTNAGETNAQDALVDEPAPALDDRIGLTVSFPTEGFGASAIQNLRDMVASKAGLIKKSLGIDALPIEETEGRISFPWFAVAPDAEGAKAYTDFITALCRAAKAQKRVTAKEREVANEKYTFRCFLLRLGFIGNEYKDSRRVLLRNLSGNGAFLGGKRKEEAQ